MPRVHTVKLEHFAGPTAAEGDFHISGDFRADVASAVREDHYCHDSACDIATAMEADCPLSAAYLLYGATECPALDAVRFAYSLRSGGIPADFARGVTPDWEDWQAYHAEHGRECEACGSYTYGDDYWTPEECGNCGAELKTLGESLGTPSSVELGEFVRGYVECALWSSNDQSDEAGGRPLEDNYGPEDIDGVSRIALTDECRDFTTHHYADMGAYARAHDWSSAGHDFWLTRNGHGAGFWDRGLGELGDRLTAGAKAYGTSDVYVGDDRDTLYFT